MPSKLGSPRLEPFLQDDSDTRSPCRTEADTLDNTFGRGDLPKT